jgi:hypothetical protein
MSAYVQLPPKYKYLGIPSSAAEQIRPTTDNMGARVPGIATLLNGEDAGKLVNEAKINQLIKIVPVVGINPGKYTLHIGWNPKLAEFGAVSCNPFAGQGTEVSLVIKAYKNFDLSELDYIFNLYVID